MASFTFVVWIMPLAVLVTVSDSCPNGWVTYEDSCYLFAFGQKGTFTESQHFCTQRHAHLVEINDVLESNFIQNFVAQSKPVDWWIGLTDQEIERTWIWLTSRTSATYTNWSPGQPDSYHGHNQDCVELLHTDSYLWHDVECSNAVNQPICEMDSESVVG